MVELGQIGLYGEGLRLEVVWVGRGRGRVEEVGKEFCSVVMNLEWGTCVYR